MAELSGRAANGGARTGGPVPVPSTAAPSGIRPPTEIMRARNAREQRRQEEQKAEEQRRATDERRRRESAERRAAAIQGTTAPRNSQASSQYTPQSQQEAFDSRRPVPGQVATSQVLGDPTGRASQEYPSGRTRGPSLSQSDQPRPAPATAGTGRRTQPTQQTPRPVTATSSAAAGTPQQPAPEQPSGAVAFPHAFHRWETLSAHWEGLTSFWLRRLEENTEKIRETIPNITTLNRQITDLSAAGANLFHAVVELQRLRASSERKFQRWFFDTRGENEKNKEIQAQLEAQLRTEREEATRVRADLLMQAENARREAAEAKRELMISKDEAHRAWDELGRRNQESLETAQSLKDGRITLVHGVQVVPYSGGPSRSGSASHRPVTRDGQGYYGSTGLGGGGYASPGDEAEYYYQQDNSPTNTDPFMETGPSGQSQYQDTPKQSYRSPYEVGSTPVSTSTAQTAIAAPGTRGPAASAQEAQRFYQHAPHETYLHGSPQPSSQAIAGGSATAAAGPSSIAPRTRQEVQSEVSYADTVSEGGTDYALDATGNVQYDAQGQPIMIAGRRRARTNESAGAGDDDYDTEADIRREQELSARYGTGMLPPEAPTVPGTSAQAMATYAPAASAGSQPDYEGAGYGASGSGSAATAGGAGQTGWETRHHHPTRLSDVLEEDEERSSRRTGE